MPIKFLSYAFLIPPQIESQKNTNALFLRRYICGELYTIFSPFEIRPATASIAKATPFFSTNLSSENIYKK